MSKITCVVLLCLVFAVLAPAGETKKTVLKFEKKFDTAPTGWKVDQTGEGEGSQWKVVADKTSPSKTGWVLMQVAEAGGRIFNLCVANDTNYQDLELTVWVKSGKGEIDQGGGPLWRYQDANNYYTARWNPIEKNFRLYHIVNGKRTQLATAEDIDIDATKWHTITIRHQGNKIECSLNGKKLLSVEDDAITKAGRIGLWTKADAQTFFAQLEAVALKGKE
jgi:hypothetical protein